MDFLELAKSRYSCRKYLQTPVEEHDLMIIFKSVRVAPSAVNFQPWQFIIVRLPENRDKVIEAYPREWIKTAPMLIIVCGDRQKSWKRNDGKDHLDIDLGIAIDHLMLQATELGLGTCCVCNFDPVTLKRNFHLPDPLEPIAIIPLGYPVDKGDSNRHDSQRLPVSEFIHRESLS